MIPRGSSLLLLLSDIFSRLAAFFGTSRGEVVGKLINSAAIWLSAWLAYQVVRRIALRILAHVHDHSEVLTAAEKRGQTVAAVVRSVGRVVILVLAVLLTAAQFIPIAPLLAAGGILGLAVSFGSQSLVKDVLAGFFILFENQFALGDVIEAAGKSGTVERMTLRVVMLRDVRGVLHVIPNGQITTVSNLTRSWSRAIVEVGVGYSANLDQALEVFRDEMQRFRSDPAWQSRLEGSAEVGVEELTQQAVVVRTMLRTTPGAQWDVAREFRRRIKNRLDAEAIPIYTMPRHLQAPPEPAPPSTDSPILPGN
ncbi:MAG TPA: mechanosensitive ion channel family protein [Gemmatimonadales bacterium]|nr:mechanosensitive ion channel family protein [Gemmatimonadales bacterium]